MLCVLSATFGVLLIESGVLLSSRGVLIMSEANERPPATEITSKGSIYDSLATTLYILVIIGSSLLCLSHLFFRFNHSRNFFVESFCSCPSQVLVDMSPFLTFLMWMLWVIGSGFLFNAFYHQKKFIPRRLILVGVSLLACLLAFLCQNFCNAKDKSANSPEVESVIDVTK